MPYALCIYFHHYMSDSFYEHLDISSIPTICSLQHFHFSEDLTTPMSGVTLTFCHLQDFVSSNILTFPTSEFFQRLNKSSPRIIHLPSLLQGSVYYDSLSSVQSNSHPKLRRQRIREGTTHKLKPHRLF